MSAGISPRSSAGYWAAMLGVAVATTVLAPFQATLSTATVALAYLLIVLFVASGWGSRPATVASVVSVLCFNFFFLPPIYAFTIDDPQNWIVLAAFLITAITAGRLSERAKIRAAAAAAARAASAYSRSVIEANLDPLVTIGDDGRIVDVNTAIEAVTGRARNELIGTDFATYFTDPQRARSLYLHAWRAGSVRDRALEIRHADGHCTSVHYSASVYRDDRGNAIGVVVAARPVGTSADEPAQLVSDPAVVRGLERCVSCASALAVTVGLLGLAGWQFGIAVLKRIIPGTVVIKPNTVVCLIVLGLSLWLMRTVDNRPVPRLRKLAGQLLAGCAAVVGLLSLSEHLVGWDLGLDQLLFRQSAADAVGSLRAGLMAPITALDISLLGVALLALDRTILWRSRRYSPAQLIAGVAGIASIVGLLDFVLKSAVSYTYIALQTAVTLCLLSIGVICARPQWGIAALLTSSSVGGTLVRGLLPAAILIPIGIGALWWGAMSAGLSTAWTGGTAMIVAMITLLATLVVWTGSFIERTDVGRRKAERDLGRREEELKEAQRLARVGSWSWNPTSDKMIWSEELYRIFGYDPKRPPPGYHEQFRCYTAESFARLDSAVQQALRTGTPYELDLELLTAEGSRRSVTGHGEVERDRAGHVLLVRGTIHDITERKQAEEAMQRSAEEIRDLYDHAPCGYHSLDGQGAFLRVNDTELNWLGYAREDVIGKMRYPDILAPRSCGAFESEFAQLKAKGGVRDIELDLVRKNGTVLPVLLSATAITDSNGNFLASRSMVYDMTERKRAEERLRRVNRAHRALSTCNQALVRATDEAALLLQICRIIIEEAGYRLCWVGYAEQDSQKTVRPVAQCGFDEDYLKAANISWADAERGRGPTGTCIRTGHIQIVKNVAEDSRMAPWRAEQLRRGYASSIAFPLLAAGTPFGALTIYSSEVDAFGDEEVRLLTELAGDLAYGIVSLRTGAERKKAEAEEMAREREVAIGFRIQQMLLLDEPPQGIAGLRVAALSIPSQRIAGDFYEFFTHQDESLDIIVADVMGKGIPAALLGAAAKSRFMAALCHLVALSPAGVLPEPRQIVTLAHASMGRHLIELESFVTLCYARVDLTRRRLDLVDCGHTGVILRRAGTGLCEWIHGSNLPLGIREGEIYDQIGVPFGVGDMFFFFSDGVTEAPNASAELFGADRLMSCVCTNGSMGPEALLSAVRAAVVAFTGTERLTDDLTCVAVEVGERPRPLLREETEIRSDLKDLSRARDFVRRFCSTLPDSPLDEVRVGELELAVNEAASNIIKHAYHGRSDQHIYLEAESFPDHVAVRLHHLGDSFDPSTAPPPSFDGSRESGFGLFILKGSVDDVHYYRDERGGNCIALIKRHKPSNERTIR